MPRPKPDDPVVTISIRLPSSLVRQIDTCMKRAQRSSPGFSITRADVIRNILTQGLKSPEFQRADSRSGT